MKKLAKFKVVYVGVAVVFAVAMAASAVVAYSKYAGKHRQSEAEAQFALGNIYWLGNAFRDGVRIAEDKQESVRLWRMAAEHGHARAQFALARAYANGDGVAEDKREAGRWYRKAAEQGHAEAQNYLAHAYSAGDGFVQDQYEAYVWWSIATVSGYEGARWVLQLNWHGVLSQSEIRSAKKEAAQRLEEIDRRKAQGE